MSIKFRDKMTDNDELSKQYEIRLQHKKFAADCKKNKTVDHHMTEGYRKEQETFTADLKILL